MPFRSGRCYSTRHSSNVGHTIAYYARIDFRIYELTVARVLIILEEFERLFSRVNIVFLLQKVRGMNFGVE